MLVPRICFWLDQNHPTLCGADAHSCAFKNWVLAAKVAVVQAGYTSGGGGRGSRCILGDSKIAKVSSSECN